MIFGVGIDLTEIERFEKTDSERFYVNCFAESEREYMRGKDAETSAGLFAAKEAVVKALGTGFRGFWPKDVEITRDASGKPSVLLHGNAARIAEERGVTKIHLSVTHNKTSAAAVAVLE